MASAYLTSCHRCTICCTMHPNFELLPYVLYCCLCGLLYCLVVPLYFSVPPCTALLYHRALQMYCLIVLPHCTAARVPQASGSTTASWRPCAMSWRTMCTRATTRPSVRSGGSCGAKWRRCGTTVTHFLLFVVSVLYAVRCMVCLGCLFVVGASVRRGVRPGVHRRVRPGCAWHERLRPSRAMLSSVSRCGCCAGSRGAQTPMEHKTIYVCAGVLHPSLFSCRRIGACR